MSDETRLMLEVGAQRIEARLAAGPRRALWVIAHPHPEYGGTMDNNVVCAARDTLQGLGFATLRFNFRGVGRSTGRFAGGQGEADDLRGLLEGLASRDEATHGLHLAGYSFGARVALQAVADGATPDSLMLFSPPLDFMSFDGVGLPPVDSLVVVGDRDGFCSLSSFEAWWDGLGASPARRERRVLAGVDHFYGGASRALGDAITAFVA